MVTDPPYELGFMGEKWDSTGVAYDVSVWRKVLRVLKPGGYLLSFGGTRTYHRMACAIEDAGFILHPMIAWIFGTGFPKATSLSKQFDQQAGAKRKVVGVDPHSANRVADMGYHGVGHGESQRLITAPATPEAEKWDGWSYGLQSLKPAIEPICMAQKPIDGKRMTDNVLKWGTGAINIDGCRIAYDMQNTNPATNPPYRKTKGYRLKVGKDVNSTSYTFKKEKNKMNVNSRGRFPANVLLDEKAAALLDKQSGMLQSGDVCPDGFKGKYTARVYGKYAHNAINPETVYADSGGASRFFYLKTKQNTPTSKCSESGG